MESEEGLISPDLNSKQFSAPQVFFGLSSFQMLAMFRRGLFYTFLSIYMRFFLRLSVTQTTLYATIPMLLSSIFQMFVWGRLSDKLQKRRISIIMGEFIAGALVIITYLVHSLFPIPDEGPATKAGFTIIIGLSITEIFWSMSNIGWSALVSDLYPDKERSRVVSQLTGLGGIGRILGVFLGGALYEGFFRFQYEGWGFRSGTLFYIAAGVIWISTIPMFFIPEGGIHAKKFVQTKESSTLQTNEGGETSISDDQFKKYIRIFAVFLIALVFINFGRNSVAVIYSQFLQLDNLFTQEIDSQLLSYIANTRSVATILSAPLVGLIAKKIGNGSTILIGSTLAIAYLLLTAFAPSLIVVFGGSFFAGVSEVIIAASSYAYAAALIPEQKRGKIFGIYNATFFLSWGLASTVITGPVVDSLIEIERPEIFSYQMGFVVGVILTVIGSLLFLFLELYRRKEKHQEEMSTEKYI